jgi:hypothetical protein
MTAASNKQSSLQRQWIIIAVPSTIQDEIRTDTIVHDQRGPGFSVIKKYPPV